MADIAELESLKESRAAFGAEHGNAVSLRGAAHSIAVTLVTVNEEIGRRRRAGVGGDGRRSVHERPAG
ncbi:MAG TPA: hypothetical protein VMA37_01510 [Acetobacteraceae bacterium]|nr:hypothetical protein [Acetobacteraceae bacterium]